MMFNHEMGFAGGFMWIFWLLLIVALVMIFKSLLGGGSGARPETPLEILKKRYARGEIDEDEFQRLRKEIEN